MAENLKRYQKFIPYLYEKSVFDIDFLQLYKQGIRLVLCDIDNTLVSYSEHEPNKQVNALLKKISDIGFEVILISNNHKKRVKLFSEKTLYKYVFSAKKPLKLGFKKALKLATKSYDKSQIVNIGDQILTDVLGGNRYGIKPILVNPIEDKTDVLSTRINRKIERFFIKRIKNKYPETFKERMSDYVNR